MIFELINKDELSTNLIHFSSLRNVMNQLNLEYKTYSLVGFPDREFELSWKEHCEEQSEKFLKQKLDVDFER